MKKFILAAITSFGAIALSSAANAAEFMTISGPSGTFGDDAVTCSASGTTGPCSFTRTFSFVTPAGFTLASADISSLAIAGNALTNIDFTSVTLNSVNFNILATGQQEFRNLLNQALVVGGNNVIAVTGTTGGEAAFRGTLSFASTSAVPEPTTWAMMLIGFGAVGYSMRRRQVGYGRLQAA
jgi:hypothetical protein